MPSSPAAGWIQTFSKPDSRASLPLATQLRPTPPAMQRFFAPVVSRSHRVRASRTCSVSSWICQARSSQCFIEGLASHLRSLLAFGEPRLVVFGGPGRDFQLAVFHLQERLDGMRPAVRRKPHQLAALVPVAEHVGGDAAVERAEARHVVEFVAEKAAAGLEPDLLDRFELRAAEPVVALGFAGERHRIAACGKRLHDVGAIAADAVDHHHHAFVERTGGKAAIGVREVVRDVHQLVRTAR